MSGFPERFGPYVLLDHLGRGGMGTVFLAIRGFQGLETTCVVKRLVPQYLNDVQHVDRFHDEASLARRFSHPNLVTTFDVGMVGSEMYLAQEHVHGRDLSQVMSSCWENRVPIPVDLAIHMARELAQALAYVHGFENLNIVHRDINPPNIRISYTGTLKLLDFGVAKSDARLSSTTENVSLGKPYYMSPEQMFDEPVDCRADIYVFGLVLWELLTLRAAGSRKVGEEILPPREGRPEMLARLRTSNYQPPSELNAEIPKELDEVVLRCLARKPTERFQNAEELIRSLNPFAMKGDAPLAMKSFMARIFDVEDDRALLKHLVEEGRSLLPTKPLPRESAPPNALVGESASSSATSRGERRRRGNRYLLLLGGALCALVMTFSVIEIAKTLAAAKKKHEGQAPAVTGPVTRPTIPNQVSPPEPAQLPQGPRTAMPELAADPADTPNPGQTHKQVRPAPAKAPTGLFDRAVISYRNGDKLEALRLLDKAIEGGAGFPALLLEGKIYLQLGQYQDAEEVLGRAIEMNPGDEDAQRLAALARSKRP